MVNNYFQRMKFILFIIELFILDVKMAINELNGLNINLTQENECESEAYPSYSNFQISSVQPLNVDLLEPNFCSEQNIFTVCPPFSTQNPQTNVLEHSNISNNCSIQQLDSFYLCDEKDLDKKINEDISESEKSISANSNLPQYTEKNEIDFLSEIIDDLTCDYGNVKNDELQIKAKIETFLSQLDKNWKLNSNSNVDNDLDAIEFADDQSVDDLQNLEVSTSRSKLDAYAARKKCLTEIRLLKREQTLLKNINLIERLYFSFEIFFLENSDVPCLNQDFFDQKLSFHKTFIEKEVQNMIFDLIEESRVADDMIRAEFIKKNLDFRQYCVFCAHDNSNTIDCIQNIESDLLYLFSNITNGHVKLQLKGFFYFKEQHDDEFSLPKFIFALAHFYREKKMMLLKLLKNFGKIGLGLTDKIKFEIIHNQFHYFIHKNIDFKIRLLPEFYSIIYSFLQMSPKNLVRENRTFLVLFFSLFSLNTLFDIISDENEIKKIDSTPNNAQRNMLLSYLSFFLRLYFIEPILNFLNIRQINQIQYQLFFTKKLLLAIEMYQGKKFDSNDSIFPDRCLSICLACRKITKSQTFLKIYFNNNFEYFCLLNRERLIHFQNYLKTRQKLLY